MYFFLLKIVDFGKGDKSGDMFFFLSQDLVVSENETVIGGDIQYLFSSGQLLIVPNTFKYSHTCCLLILVIFFDMDLNWPKPQQLHLDKQQNCKTLGTSQYAKFSNLVMHLCSYSIRHLSFYTRTYCKPPFIDECPLENVSTTKNL